MDGILWNRKTINAEQQVPIVRKPLGEHNSYAEYFEPAEVSIGDRVRVRPEVPPPYVEPTSQIKSSAPGYVIGCLEREIMTLKSQLQSKHGELRRSQNEHADLKKLHQQALVKLKKIEREKESVQDELHAAAQAKLEEQARADSLEATIRGRDKLEGRLKAQLRDALKMGREKDAALAEERSRLNTLLAVERKKVKAGRREQQWRVKEVSEVAEGALSELDSLRAAQRPMQDAVVSMEGLMVELSTAAQQQQQALMQRAEEMEMEAAACAAERDGVASKLQQQQQQQQEVEQQLAAWKREAESRTAEAAELRRGSQQMELQCAALSRDLRDSRAAVERERAGKLEEQRQRRLEYRANRDLAARMKRIGAAMRQEDGGSSGSSRSSSSSSSSNFRGAPDGGDNTTTPVVGGGWGGVEGGGDGGGGVGDGMTTGGNSNGPSSC